MLENGWVLTVDRDYAAYCGAESWIDKKDIGDGDISDFVWEKNLSMDVAQVLTGAYEPDEVVGELLELLRKTNYRPALERAEYKVAEEHYKQFDEYMKKEEHE